MGGIAMVPGRGRKPKPVARKRAAGNPGKRALNNDEPDFGLVTDIEPPEWIMGRAREMWVRVAPLLCNAKVLQVTDLHNVEAFCFAYSNLRAARDHIEVHGIVVEGATGGMIKNPAVTVQAEADRQIVTFGSMLGLDPASRQRLVGGGNKKAGNPFSALIDG